MKRGRLQCIRGSSGRSIMEHGEGEGFQIETQPYRLRGHGFVSDPERILLFSRHAFSFRFFVFPSIMSQGGVPQSMTDEKWSVEEVRPRA